MIRFFALIARREDVTPQQFHDHWRHPHGTMGRLIPNLRSYVQGHQIHTDLLGPDQNQFEGIAISGFDSAAEAMGFGDEPQYVEHVQPDEPLWADQSKLQWLNTNEEVLVPRAKIQDGASYGDSLWNDLDRATTIQLLQFVRADGNRDWAGDDDAELGQRIGALRHTRNRPDPEVHGDDPPYLGVRQLWWPTLSAFEAGVAADRPAFDELVARGGNAITVLVQSERFLR